MANNIKKIVGKFLKKPVLILVIVILVGGAAAYGYFGRNKKQAEEFTVAQRRDIVQEVNVTGRIQPAESVDLSFEKSGKVAKAYKNVGDKVSTGQIIVSLESSEISAQLLQAQASFESERARLEELENGTRPEEIQTYQTKVANAERSLLNAKNSLEAAKQKAEADLDDVYQDAILAAQEAVNTGKTALLTLTDIQYSNFSQNTQEGLAVASAKAAAIKALLGADDAGRWTSLSISTLSGGLFGKVQDAVNNTAEENIETLLAETISALQKVKYALDAVPVNASLTGTEKTNLNTEKTNVSLKITAVSAKQTAISVQKAANASSISSAQTTLTTAENTLASARDDLTLKQAGIVQEQIASQKAQVKSAESNVKYYQAQLAKTIIRAPISGIITLQDGKAGQTVLANTTIVSLISEAEFEIEANVPEADVAKIKLGDSARATLDAYGRDIAFDAKIVEIDPAETIVEGVPTYKATLQFLSKDERFKSGMTVNIDIYAEKRENAISLPQRSIVRRDGEQFVRLLKGDSFEEVVVRTGLKGSDGNIEIISGVEEGDKVAAFGAK